ncbi:MAG TPA: glutathione S-transferase family protein [Burkholderiaceae bacterium]|jgi:glutathione S-transferase|nr:glutathione S-transferase family protein [Burkholderiaceae bacterium]
MTSTNTITLFHSPQSRSSGTLTMLEELQAPYELHLINMKAGEQRQAAYMAINPMGKVPAIWHRGQLVTEQVAIFLYLADLFSDAGLAPAIGDPSRGPYLRWMVYYAACYEPAVVDKAMKREAGPLAMSPYGDFDLMLGTVIKRLSESPYLLGDRFSAADLLWGMALQWGTMFGMVPEHPVIAKYVESVISRPSFIKVADMDIKWAAEHEAAVKPKAAA